MVLEDMLDEAGVDPWEGYIAAAKQLNLVLRQKGIGENYLTVAFLRSYVAFNMLFVTMNQI